MDEFDDDIDNEVNDILSQLRNKNNISPTPEIPKEPLEKEKMEDFIIQNAANNVRNAVEMVENLKGSAIASGDPELVNAMSGLLKATTSAIDSLTKLKIAEDKNKNQKEIAQINLEGKKSADDEDKKGFLISREEVIKALMNKKKDDEESPEPTPVTVDI
jgi:valyl-tRNA synthetase